MHSLRLLRQLRLAILQHFVAHVQNDARNRQAQSELNRADDHEGHAEWASVESGGATRLPDEVRLDQRVFLEETNKFYCLNTCFYRGSTLSIVLTLRVRSSSILQGRAKVVTNSTTMRMIVKELHVGQWQERAEVRTRVRKISSVGSWSLVRTPLVGLRFGLGLGNFESWKLF